jgi:hypothetical protein
MAREIIRPEQQQYASIVLWEIFSGDNQTAFAEMKKSGCCI